MKFHYAIFQLKKTVKYLGIYISRNLKERQEKNFNPKIQKTKNILNMWLQRDVSMIGRNKRRHLQKEILAGSRAEGGVELLDFGDLNYGFKIKWIKESRKAPDSLWYFIPVNVFEKMGGLQFLLLCDYDQTLTAAKLCFVHNFSPHKTIIWNNEYITRKNKSLYLQKWMDKNIIYLSDIQSETGQLLSYEEFLKSQLFPVTFKEFKRLLMLSTVEFYSYQHGIDIKSKRCTNKHIRKYLYSKRKISPCGKCFWGSHFTHVHWEKSWTLPHKFVINNKIREVHFKILHNIYPTNSNISHFVNIGTACEFRKSEEEDIKHLFFECCHTKLFWRKMELYFANKTTHTIKLELKAIILDYMNNNQEIQYIVNLFILIGKFHIHKSKFSKTLPSFESFNIEVDNYIKSIRLLQNKKSQHTIRLYEEIFN
ncbi:hypothetical protein Q5P01_006974 [Channa striata]|uniref:Reverse transcriptase zinc-binding domain-containing protein n=1 Tax=Channa striata TaxID=64152 RepID=A0AA88SZA6_CHASR|nr:hypothetical protein Q5P01_006974 [Channa striata]